MAPCSCVKMLSLEIGGASFETLRRVRVGCSMPELTTDRIVQILLGLAAAGGLSFGGLSNSDASSCRELLQDERSTCRQTLEIVAGGYAESLQALRDVCREAR